MSHVEVCGYRLALDRSYDPASHLWVQILEPGRVRVGVDPLGVETSGTIAQLAFASPGEVLRRGEPFGSLEAAKFVGPLLSPLSGTVTATNQAALADPRLVERDPFGEGWLVELEPSDPGGELPLLVEGEERLCPWFAAEVQDYRLKGLIAE
ncbi:MAG: glycine cleavage system protein H [Actinomycetota bacterium]|nr:glycine cleavage system protein H [Actinomycetota bacterium]